MGLGSGGYRFMESWPLDGRLILLLLLQAKPHTCGRLEIGESAKCDVFSHDYHSGPQSAPQGPGAGLNFGPPSLPFHKKGRFLDLGQFWVFWCGWAKNFFLNLGPCRANLDPPEFVPVIMAMTSDE